jgi:two-component system sensor histidine kinase AgrC
MNCFLIAIFYHVALGVKNNFNKNLLFATVSSIGIMIVRIFFEKDIIMFASILIFIAVAIPIFKFGIIKTIIGTFLAQVAAFVGEFIVMLIFTITNTPPEKMLADIKLLIWGNVVSSFAFACIIIVIYYFKIKINYVEDINRKKNIGIVFNAIITLLLVSPNLIFFVNNSRIIPIWIIIFNFLSVIVFFALSTYNTYKGSELENKKSELENQKLYIKTLNDLVDGLRLFKHDFANIINAIGGHITLNNMEGLKRYFSELVQDYHSMNNLSSINDTMISNPSLYGLIVSKLYLAEAKGIKMNAEITADLNHSHMKIYELCRVLGILLDNAIEANQTLDDKFINISIKLLDNTYIVSIENPFSQTLSVNEIYKKGTSSKGENRGLGLWEVNQITHKYKSVNLKTSIDNKNKIFKQELYLHANLLKNAM